MGGPIKYSVGLAFYDKPPYPESVRAMFTAMSLLIHHRQHVDEVLLINNNPTGDNPLKNLPVKIPDNVRYVEMPSPQGTSPPRNRVFEEARNEFVACMDSHVLLYPNSFEHLERFYNKHGRDCPDLLHGQIMVERPGRVMSSHMNVQWRDSMLGTWGCAWKKNGVVFSTRQGLVFAKNRETSTDELIYVTMPEDCTEQRPMTEQEIEELLLPIGIGWGGHEQHLRDNGCTNPTLPFPVPGHGMGFFACRKDSWLPFHEGARGFGGEEITTGYRYRKAGRRCWTIPGVKWWHHFERMNGGQVPYSLSLYDRIRNYTLEYLRLGRDIQELRDYFKKCSSREWRSILDGREWPYGVERKTMEDKTPSNYETASAARLEKNLKDASLVGQRMVSMPKNLHECYELAKSLPSTINADLHHLKHLAATCGRGQKPGRVVEIVHQCVSGIALLAGKPKVLTSYGMPPDSDRGESLMRMTPEGTTYKYHNELPNGEPIPKCDLLLLDVQPHTAFYYRQLLDIHESRVGRYIAIHNTHPDRAHGLKFGAEEGMMPAIGDFLQEHKREWHLVGTHSEQNGLMVLSRQVRDNSRCTGKE